MSVGSQAALSLSGRTALVTGASRGIGASVLGALAAAGARVVATYCSNKSAAEELCASLCDGGAQAECVELDVSSEKSVAAAFKEISDRFSSLDILVNNAGVTADSLILRQKTEDWQRVLDVNLRGCFFCARAASKLMLKAKWGRIINISSVVGQMGNAGQVAYSASKAGLFGLTKSLARELASRGVTVNAVAPGYIETDMTASLKEDLRGRLLSGIPLGRFGSGDDVAGAVLFLASSLGDYVTGQVIGVNGGMHM